MQKVQLVNYFVLQPSMYTTGGHKTVYDILDEVWGGTVHTPSDGGTYYLIFGFGRFNGGMPFFERFRKHVASGGDVRAIVSGATYANHTSKQLVQALLECGAHVQVVNRKKMLHAKVYGHRTPKGEETLVTTSGNFTSPGTKTNIEAATVLGPDITEKMGFSSVDLLASFNTSGLDIYTLTSDQTDPAWSLLFDENQRRKAPASLDAEAEDDEDLGSSAFLLKLGHSDTVRIQAARGTKQSAGSQYFWLPMDAFGFFPPLDIRNVRGDKATYSTEIEITYDGLSLTDKTRVTFEAENNKDFRLGTGALRNTGIADINDLMVLTRDDERSYTMRIVKAGSNEYDKLLPYALTPVGPKGKMAGYIPLTDLGALIPG